MRVMTAMKFFMLEQVVMRMIMGIFVIMLVKTFQKRTQCIVN